MIRTTEEIAGPMPVTTRAAPRTLKFTARDITGVHEITVDDMPGDAPAGEVARSLATRLNLPTNVPWSLRSDTSAEYLKDDVDLASQLPETGAKLTISPRTHLG